MDAEAAGRILGLVGWHAMAMRKRGNHRSGDNEHVMRKVPEWIGTGDDQSFADRCCRWCVHVESC